MTTTEPTAPPSLKSGDEVCVVAPATSLSFIAEDRRELAKRRFGEFGHTTPAFTFPVGGWGSLYATDRGVSLKVSGR